MEWVIVDALVCNKVRQFGDSLLVHEWNLKDVLFAGSAALEGKGMATVLHGIARAKLIRWFMRLLLFLVLPIAGIWYGVQKENMLLIFLGAAVGGLYLSWSAYLTIRSEIMRLLGRQPPKTALQGKLELWDLMHNAYRMLSGPVVDPTRALRALDTAAEKGAVWDGAVYAVLNRVMARDPTAWVTDDSHSYRSREDGSDKASTA